MAQALQLPHDEIVSLIAVPKPIEFIEHNREELLKELRFNQRLEFSALNTCNENSIVL